MTVKFAPPGKLGGAFPNHGRQWNRLSETAMQKKFQVFVSSTYADLVDERQDTLKSILDLGHIPSGMEGFFAADQEQLSYIQRIIDECDYYILIIAGRYGSVDEHGVSYTEREYDYAVGKGVTVLAFIHNNASLLPAAKVDTDPNDVQRLKSFKDKVSKKRLVSFWKEREELRANVTISLSKAIRDVPGIGWVRGDTVATDDILAQLNGVRNEVDRLRAENHRLKEQVSPKVDDIASLDDVFRIHYSYYNRELKHRYQATVDLKWAEIFKVVGPSFFSPSTPAKIGQDLEYYVSHAKNDSRSGEFSVYNGDLDTIKIQMSAYGFIEIYTAQNTQGGAAEFMRLTGLGKRALVELMAVRTSQSVA